MVPTSRIPTASTSWDPVTEPVDRFFPRSPRDRYLLVDQSLSSLNGVLAKS